MSDSKVRIDKWLWAARLYKTRSLATTACDQGKISIGNQVVKASRIIKSGDKIQIKRTGITLQLEIIQMIDKRVGAKLIPSIYIDQTPPEDIESFKARTSRITIFRDPGTGRPTKKERRDLDEFINPYEQDELE